MELAELVDHRSGVAEEEDVLGVAEEDDALVVVLVLGQFAAHRFDLVLAEVDPGVAQAQHAELEAATAHRVLQQPQSGRFVGAVRQQKRRILD